MGILALYAFYFSLFNISDGVGERLREDKCWKYGVPAVGMPTSSGCSIVDEHY